MPISVLFQSTLPRRERLFCVFLVKITFMISIHTPTKGATLVFTTIFMYSRISIHTPTKGATNATAYEYLDLVISIHTPTKGATQNAMWIMNSKTNFNPHSHEGSDRIDKTIVILNEIFQSTLPRRERHLQLQRQQIN